MQGEDLIIAQISDLHIKPYRNLLIPIVEHINKIIDIDLVIVTGDLAHNEKYLEYAVSYLNKIKHKVVAIPGERDCGKEWERLFGNTYNNLKIKGWDIVLVDTSFMGDRFFDGWSDTIKNESPEQYKWLMNKFHDNSSWNIVFSHHPFWSVLPNKSELLTDNIRAIYSGHLHIPKMMPFVYSNPKNKKIEHGFSGTVMDFHGNSLYLIIKVSKDGMITHFPQRLDTKIKHEL